MFLPSLITGILIKKFGHSNIMYAGVFLYSITIIASFLDQTYYNYMFALIFLGLGWNFLFISGTSLLVLTYKEEEKFRAQGLNDFIVYTVHAIGSLSAGILIALTNWKMMNIWRFFGFRKFQEISAKFGKQLCKICRCYLHNYVLFLKTFARYRQNIIKIWVDKCNIGYHLFSFPCRFWSNI